MTGNQLTASQQFAATMISNLTVNVMQLLDQPPPAPKADPRAAEKDKTIADLAEEVGRLREENAELRSKLGDPGS